MDTVSKTKNDGKEKYFLGWTDIERCIYRIVDWYRFNKIEAKNIYGIPRGGLIPAVMLSHKLNLPLIFDEEQIDKETIVIDDIEDGGMTMGFIHLGYKVVLYSKLEKDSSCDYYSEPIGKHKWVVFSWEVPNE
ncbi:hypothetical protein KKG81_04655 [bacterium]|nr:hypothetical protein [bacterium]